MGSYTVIADTSRSLLELLRGEMSPEPISKPESIGLAAPNDSENFMLCLNLYNIEENPGTRSAERLTLDKNHMQDPPISMSLYYMLFANVKGDALGKAVDEQRILSRAIQAMNDNRRVPGKYLLGTLKESAELIEITNMNLSLEEKVRAWSLYNQPYKICMFYKVGPTILESRNIHSSTRVKSVEIVTDHIEKKSR